MCKTVTVAGFEKTLINLDNVCSMKMRRFLPPQPASQSLTHTEADRDMRMWPPPSAQA